MNKYSAKKIAVLVAFGLVAFVLAGIFFAGNASAAAPSVQTEDASDIGDESATLNGYLYTQGEDTTYWFEYGTSRSNLNRVTSEREVSDRGGRVTVYNTIRNGLNYDQTYYFRLVAENNDGTDKGEILSFRTGDDSNNGNSDNLDVDTLSARLNGNYATFSGRVYPDGNSGRVWFRYGQSRNSLDFTTSKITYFGGSSRSFSQTSRKLVDGETYYYQAVAEDSNDTVYGNVLSFTVSDNGNGNDNGQNDLNVPSAVTNSATATGPNSATLRAQVDPNGNLSSVWFEYGRTTSLGNATTRDSAGSGTVSNNYSANLNNLAAGTTYYYRAVAQNSAGTSRGQILSFRTTGTPIVPITPPVNPTNNNGNGNPKPTVLGVSTGAPGCFSVSPAISSSQLKGGQDFTYSVVYKNDCGYTLSGASLQITLPAPVEYAGTNYPFLSRDGNVITYNLGVVATNFQSTVTVDGRVRSQVNDGDSLIFQANIAFTNPRGGLENASGYLSAMIVSGGDNTTSGTSTLSASAADALGGLFHSGWFWIVLFLILIALFVFWLATRRRDGEDDEEDEAPAH